MRAKEQDGTAEAFVVGNIPGLPGWKQLIGFASNKVRALLAYLAVEADRPHNREVLATLLWSDSPQQKALNNLRNALSNLRKQLEEPQAGIPFVWVNHDTLQFNTSSDYWLDVNEIRRLAAPSEAQAVSNSSKLNWMERMAQAVEYYKGDFLEGLSVDSLSFESGLPSSGRGFIRPCWRCCTGWGNSIWRWRIYKNSTLRPTPDRVGILAGGSLPTVDASPWPWQAGVVKPWLYTKLAAVNWQTNWASLLVKKPYACMKISAMGNWVLPSRQKARSHNLPAQLTSFIGREQEITEVSRLVSEHRLVTLTGSGGTGKNPPSIAGSEGLPGNLPDGVFFIELASLSDPALVPQVCAQTLELVEQPNIPIQAVLAHYLEKKHLLLILDNCEHVISACTSLVVALLKACPRLHILATSREILSVPGEFPLRVPSLTVPDPIHLPAHG